MEEIPCSFNAGANQLPVGLEECCIGCMPHVYGRPKPRLEVGDGMEFRGEIDPVPVNQVAKDILPVIRQLQSRADCIAGSKLFDGAGFACKCKEQSSHRVGAAAAISKDLVPCAVSSFRLILFKGVDQCLEGGLGKFVSLHDWCQGHEYGM